MPNKKITKVSQIKKEEPEETVSLDEEIKRAELEKEKTEKEKKEKEKKEKKRPIRKKPRRKRPKREYQEKISIER